MYRLKIALLSLTLGSSMTMAECMGPDAPTVPKGASATMEQMLEGQKAVKAFQAANIEYMSCVEKAMTDAEAAAKKGGSAEEKKAAQARYDQAVDTYNTAVSSEEQVAEQFNTEIRAYKAASAK